MQINLNQLRTFFLVAKEKSITKAAHALHITQPAVTMQIKAFEKNLGVKFIRKSGKELQLTDMGNVLYGYAERIFQVVEELEYALKGYGDLTQGSLTIGTTRSFARHLMPGLLSRFQERFPSVKVYLKVGSSQEIADRVAAFKHDLGIIGHLPHMNKLKVLPYTKEEFCVVISPNHRLAAKSMISISELKDEPIIIRENGSGSRHAILSMLASYDMKPSVLVEAGSVEFIKEYTIKERGISFLYKPEIELEAKMGLLNYLDIKEGPIWIQTDIVFPRKAKLSPPAEAFLQIIRSGVLKTEEPTNV
ncbi:MAG: LysR family transcriptional regulator [Desulfobacterales bacterium]|jgi:DNA-binding transcriptional LysR family regulator